MGLLKSLVVAGSMVCCLTASAQEMWGIRNLNLNYNDTVYTNLNASYYASGAVWNRFQQTPGAPYDWSSLDRVIDSTINVFGGELVLLLDISGSWAVDTGAGDQPPLDLDRSLDLAATVPDSGYSPTLFTFVRDLMAHLDAVYTGTVWLRFSNEPQFNWAEDHTLEQNDSVISDYIRCLRTVYRAAHDTTGISDSLVPKVSHGGIYVDFWQKYHWYLLGGNGGIRVQDSVVTLFQSRYNERTVQDYTDWYDVVSKVRESGEKARRNWVLRLVAQTAWMDYWDVHYHFKPRFLQGEYLTWQGLVLDSGGTEIPWFSAETAMQLANPASRFNPYFHAGDMVRKWMLSFYNGLEGICTPLVGIPNDKFFGLFDPNDVPYYAYGAWKVAQPFFPNRSGFRVIRADSIFQFHHLTTHTDVLWGDALFDYDIVSEDLELPMALGIDSASVIDMLGQLQDRFYPGDTIRVTITQEPIYVQYHFNSGPFTIPNQYVTPKNSTVGAPGTLWRLYPNPARERVTLAPEATDSGEPWYWQVTDLYGRKVTPLVRATGPQDQLEVTGLPAGFYVVRFRDAQGRQHARTLVVR